MDELSHLMMHHCCESSQSAGLHQPPRSPVHTDKLTPCIPLHAAGGTAHEPSTGVSKARQRAAMLAVAQHTGWTRNVPAEVMEALHTEVHVDKAVYFNYLKNNKPKAARRRRRREAWACCSSGNCSTPPVRTHAMRWIAY